MLIIPAIDIIGGKVVRLQQGDFDKQKFYSDDPVEIARMWEKRGASFLHIVDLDGAREGVIKNRDIILRIIKTVTIPCEIGGGLREEEDIASFLDNGARRVVLGTKAIEESEWLEEILSEFQEKIVISIDFAGEYVVKRGWQEETDLRPEAVALKMQSIGVKRLIVTDIAMDGTLIGPNIVKLKEILACVDILVIGSGGISSLEDIKRLKEIDAKNLEGIIIGRAFYEGKIDLEEALRIVLC